MTQQDLFDSSAGLAMSAKKKISFLDRYRLTLRFDHAVFVAIGFLMLYVLTFSFGVEQGKHFAAAEIRAERSKRDRMTEEFRLQIMQLQNAVQPQASKSRVDSGVVRTPVRNESVVPLPQDAPAVTGPVSEALTLDQAAVPATITKPDGKYTIQTVTYKVEADALKQIEKLKGMGLHSFIIPSGTYLQVCVDAFQTKQQAVQALQQMKTKGLVPPDAYVRNIPA